MKHVIFPILFILFPCLTFAQKNWTIEAEDPSSTVTWSKDGVADIVAPKGLTLWNTNLMKGNVTIEYDARIVVGNGDERLSDLNCFWMATDTSTKDGSVFTNMKKRKGVFVNQYSLQLYYMGYGGNYNSTTRFRRYDGDKRGVSDAKFRPSILREYTDSEHLLQTNHWYHIRLEQTNGHVKYFIDGECLVDYVDIQPLTKGYFGFRTTLSHAQLKNFHYTCTDKSSPIALTWVGGKRNTEASPQTFGIPFAQGELPASTPLSLKTSDGTTLPHDEWNLAYWQDGSIKWKAVAAVIPANTESCIVEKSTKKAPKLSGNITDNGKQIVLSTGSSLIYISKNGGNIIDSIVTNGIKTTGRLWMEYDGKQLNARKAYIDNHQSLRTIDGNQAHPVRSTVKIDGDCFTLRLYSYAGSDEIKIVQTLIVDSLMNEKGIKSLGLRADIPMRDLDYKRSIAFAHNTFDDQTRKFNMDVKPLIARRQISLNEDGEPANELSRRMINDIASWDGFRLSQLSPNAYSIRKRATDKSPWIGTVEGHRAPGTVAVGDSQSHVVLTMNDFWQSYPSTLQIDNARTDMATASMWLWSPEAEPMSFEHYDTIPHGLDAAYEDIQPGMSTAYGIARTTTFFIKPSTESIGSFAYSEPASALVPSPEYLHEKRAFGIWSLPQKDTEENNDVKEMEKELKDISDFYDNEIEKNGWYGFFNYGDVMHTYDKSREEWRYDVGGYAWDNTELASNAMLWYMYLRTGDEKLWRKAVAMTRHTSEVDCYHIGPHASLGSRHNVSHWGCGAKEARISQAFWNRFLYYLTADERTGDLMTEVKDADLLLYTLDPMRLAQPRSEENPCTAPARLRVGPDWVAYASNWFTEWERTGNKYYYDKILTGMRSIAAMPHGLFSGPKALGYDPATGIVTWEGDTAKQNTNHLLAIMGGFEMMNEMLLSIDCKEWNDAWLDHACNYKDKAITISRNKFRIPRLQAYGYWKTGRKAHRENALSDIMRFKPTIPSPNFFTNDAATWSLDAIFFLETCLR